MLKLFNMLPIAIRLGVSLILLSFVAYGSAADQKDIYRLGYANELTLAEAVSDYNDVHRLDSVAKQYAELDIKEIEPAVIALLKQTPRGDRRRIERISSIAKLVAQGKLPKGTLLTFQYSNKSRTVYWHDMPTINRNFWIILWSGLDENPLGSGEFNDKAYILEIPIRCSARKDSVFLERKKSKTAAKG